MFKQTIKQNKIFLIFFLLFLLFYILNFDEYTLNTYATDYHVRYKYYGIKIINDILNLDFSSNFYLFGQPNHQVFFNSYFLPEFITGLLLHITPNDFIFGIISNLLNMFLLFFSIKIFFKCLNLEYENQTTFIFFTFFFIYLANWVWVFWKLAEIYFLFIFSLIFYFLIKGIESKKIYFILIAFCLTCLSFITKPQSLAIIPFFIFSILILYFRKLKYLKTIILLLVFYFSVFPLIVYFTLEYDQNNLLFYFYKNGNINANIFYEYSDFLSQFNLSENNFTKILYCYFLIFKKTIYQITFLRESYSLKHNIFLIFYSLLFYFILIINLDNLVSKHKNFTKLTFLIYIFTLLLHSSLNMSAEPNRTVLFYLIPLYILFSISAQKTLKSLILIIKK